MSVRLCLVTNGTHEGLDFKYPGGNGNDLIFLLCPMIPCFFPDIKSSAYNNRP
ncbi:MAG: hypothetical protein IJR35_08045 [Synergistaceae bacterium]|nr:hypothetical protein [Synergistaceae bacterium]